jgi:hypothetical protein
MALFDALGFSWDRGSLPRQWPRASVERTTFRFARMLPEYVWDAGVLEGNPFTFPEVKTLLEGVTVGGRKLSDQEQILNLAQSSKYLLELIRSQQFRLDKTTFCALHARVAGLEALEWGLFCAQPLDAVFSEGLAALEENVPNPFERAMAFFLFGSLQQFFTHGSEYTPRLMMNGSLMMEGIDAISIPAMQAAEFNSRMVEFYATRNATQMMGFVVEFHPDFLRICELNPELSLVRSAPAIRQYRFDDPLPTPIRAT